MTSNFVEENAADINGTVISVAVVCCLIAFVRRVVRSLFCFEKWAEYSRVEEFFLSLIKRTLIEWIVMVRKVTM